jgi:hypothetical protein
MKLHSALDVGGGRVVKMASVPSLGRFPVQAAWEMSVTINSRRSRGSTNSAERRLLSIHRAELELV